MGIGPRGMRDMGRDLQEVCPDFLSQVTLRIDGQPDMAVAALSEPVTWKELDPTGGNVLRTGTQFIWQSWATPRPPIGAIIIDTKGIYWTVYRVTQKDWVDTWEPLCLALNVANHPWNTGLLLTATYTHGEAGEAKASWVGYFSGQDPPLATDSILCHFQPWEETASIQFGAEFDRERFRVYLERPLPIKLAGGEYRIVDSDGERYRIERYVQEGRLDALPIAVATKVTEGAEYYQQGVPPAFLS